MFLVLIIITVAVWFVVGLYSLGTLRSIPRRAWVSAVGVLAALGLSALTYQEAKRTEVKERFQRHFVAGIDEREHGNLEEAERQFQEARNIIPGHPEVERQLKELKQEKPAEKRVQSRATRVDPSATAQPTPPPPANAPTPAPDKRIGEQPKPL
ncbi:MAG: hypothetical protein ACO1SX_28895, partial [Actinomycetota bacterium]